MISLKTKLKLEVLFSPNLWMRNEEIDEDYDKWLWDALTNNPVIELQSVLGQLSEFTVKINGREVWMCNAPYADAVNYENGCTEHSPSRATALLFRKKVKPLIKEATKFKS